MAIPGSQHTRLLSSQVRCPSPPALQRPSPPPPTQPPPPPPPNLHFQASRSPTRRSSSMRRLLRRLSRVAAADSCTAAGAYQPLRPDAVAKASAPSSFFGARRLGGGARVPEGHVPVCVGEEGGHVERFAVRTELLGQPAFAALLRRAAQEYGYGHPGALRIPCPVADFRLLLVRLSATGDHADADDALLY